MMWNKLNRLTKVAGLGDGSSKVLKAISLRDFDELETLVQQTPAKLNDRVTKNKGTLLTEAIRTEDEELVRWLVKHGADLNLQTRQGATALMLACQQKQHSVVEHLVKHNAKINIQAADGKTALLVACCGGEPDTDQVVEGMPVEFPGYPMYPPMFSPESPPTPTWSSSERDASISTTISGCESRSISAAASSPPSEKQATAGEEEFFDAFLSHSWGEGETNHELVRSINEVLCNAGVKTWFDGERVTDNIRQEIARGIRQSQKAVIFITSEYMAKLDSDDSNFCKEEFQAAANMLKPKNMIPVVLESSLLDPGSWRGLLQLQLGSKLYVDFSTPEKRQKSMDYLIELDAQDMKGQTALMLLCQDGESKTARLLVQYGATLEIQDSKGWTALIHAIKNENDEVARMLLQQKGNVDIQTKAGCTALQCACDHGQPALVRQLIDDGANVDHQEASGVTSLMFACYRGEQGIARLLISNGANVNLRTNDARTALLLACEEKQHNIAELLVNHGAYLDAQDPEGRTALMIACGDRVSKVARLLIKCGADLEVQDRKGWTALIHAIKNGNLISGGANVNYQQLHLKTWFDGDRLSGNIRQEIAHGLENTEKVVVFITREYMEKLKSKGSDYCKEEFQAAEKVVGQENLIPVILESSMLDKSSWRGPLVLVLGDYLHVDFTTPEKREENMEYLVKRIQARVSN
ncbi:Ankyrin repeat domain-containing protein 29 [Hondaea fermentalgiana]|uniref:Ankyrin repeat domain-containing protein 29 n=1 Tax=Hondaea fermentalgiana TaxID=2315210 RepID=A0A2R5GK58_9STRA|nr:Ankyrin repeat domain-containing protein 29 [Hondaea fermentalgiana]|eukprot:GBG31296.1 Ankyrin repeat domain-containing protein 29 [Hondaea fermentalgiana]